ncbi:MAG: hypothetical protein Q8Q42_03420 [Nanoarchaeota archaeon]|nr:hypothetical protein [Nanoarchaeota archaeon]
MAKDENTGRDDTYERDLRERRRSEERSFEDYRRARGDNKSPADSDGIVSKLTITSLLVFIVAYLTRGTSYISIVWVAGILVLLAIFWKKIIPEPLRNIIGKIFKILLFIGVITFLVIFIFQGFTTGSWKILSAQAEESGAEKAVGNTMANWWGYVKNPNRLYDDKWKNPDVVEQTPQRGIRIYGLETRKSAFAEDEDIILSGNAEVNAFSDLDAKVSFRCAINDSGVVREGEFSIHEMGDGVNEITVYAGHDEDIGFNCRFDGINLELDDKERNDKERTTKIFTADIQGIYEDFTTTSELKVYSLTREKMDELTGKDPFKELGLNDPSLEAGNKMRSSCFSGCGLTKVALKTSKQPQTEVGTYLLSIGIKKDADWYGDIVKIKKIEVNLPESNFELVGCEYFGGDNILDENEPYMEVKNKEIKENKYTTTYDLGFYCDYKITRARSLLSYDLITVDTTYDYMVKKKETIHILEKSNYNFDEGESIDDTDEVENESNTVYYNLA